MRRFILLVGSRSYLDIDLCQRTERREAGRDSPKRPGVSLPSGTVGQTWRSLWMARSQKSVLDGR